MKCRECPAWQPIDEVDGYCEIRGTIMPINGECKLSLKDVHIRLLLKKVRR